MTSPPEGVTAVPHAAGGDTRRRRAVPRFWLRHPQLLLGVRATVSLVWHRGRGDIPSATAYGIPCIAQLISLQVTHRPTIPPGWVGQCGAAQAPLAPLSAWCHHVASRCPHTRVCRHPPSDTLCSVAPLCVATLFWQVSVSQSCSTPTLFHCGFLQLCGTIKVLRCCIMPFHPLQHIVFTFQGRF